MEEVVGSEGESKVIGGVWSLCRVEKRRSGSAWTGGIGHDPIAISNRFKGLEDLEEDAVNERLRDYEGFPSLDADSMINEMPGESQIPPVPKVPEGVNRHRGDCGCCGPKKFFENK